MFNVGDYVVRTGNSIGGIVEGKVYQVREVDYDFRTIKVNGNHSAFDWDKFRLEVRPLITTTTLAIQHGGNHYKKLKIQPVEYIMANSIPYMEGNVIKYVSRWKDKGGIEDLKKAKHYLEILIENEQKND